MAPTPDGGGPESLLEEAEDAEKPWLGRYVRVGKAVPLGRVLVQERYLSFISTPLDVRGWRRHVELHRAIVEGRKSAQDAAEDTCCGAWGADLGELRAAGLFAGAPWLAEQIRQEITAGGDEAKEMTAGALDDVVYVACVFHQNAFSYQGANGRRIDVLFPGISRANHSCEPNAVIIPCEKPQESKLVALRPIAEGEPVEICYCPTQYLLRTTTQRREVLKDKWGFLCRCSRCEAPHEAARSFALRCGGCGGAEAAVAAEGEAGEALCSLRCPSCGGQPEDREQARLALAEEAAVEELVLSLPEPEDMLLPEPEECLKVSAPDVFGGLRPEDTQRCAAFAAAHPRHRIATEVSRRQAAVLHAQSLHKEAAAAQTAFVAGVRRLLPEGAFGFHWFVEIYARLAYLQELAGQRSEAKEAVRQVLASMAFTQGGRPPRPGDVMDLMPSRTWLKLLMEVGPELI